eukprot:TRINITY_DN11322_c0_g2_i1.p1 TRINITY_DN11322_c0_g2~~TRINITY_DN11322_c0_g2_i1.p1  ORF type:complete len:103 (+),score=15.30 TRINITY_DN11322_c0_g2_i1:337-645(+)
MKNLRSKDNDEKKNNTTNDNNMYNDRTDGYNTKPLTHFNFSKACSTNSQQKVKMTILLATPIHISTQTDKKQIYLSSLTETMKENKKENLQEPSTDQPTITL